MSMVFAGSPLDRASDRRRDRSWLEERMRDARSRYVALWRLQALVRSGARPSIAWANREITECMDEHTGAIFLGLDGAVAHFAVDVSGLEHPDVELGLAGAARFSDVRAAAGQLPASDAAILAQARSLVDWHANHRFCAACGEATKSAEGGAMRVCEKCDAEHFPRTNPVVITLVSRANRCLLGRQPGWPPGLYSALAGFIEPGETVEEAARREVREETRVAIGQVRYHASQPWPFPSSLMIGCLAEALSEEIVVDAHELDDARWFARERILRALASPDGREGFFVPPPLAIAHQLIRAWADSA